MIELPLDIDEYIAGYENENLTIPDKSERLFALGREFGAAIISEFPDATVIVLPEAIECI